MATMKMPCAVGSGSINMQSAEITLSNLSSVTWYNNSDNPKADLTVTFDTPFSSVPKVYVRSKYDSGDYGNSKYVAGSPSNISTTGFVLSVIQGQFGSGSHTYTFEWVAFTD